MKRAMTKFALPFLALWTLGGLTACGGHDQGVPGTHAEEPAAHTRATPPDENGTFLLSGASDSFCPPGTTLLQSHWLCATATEAVGPFTPAMVEKCKAWGGAAACGNARWGLAMAKSARGTGQCPLGSTFDSALQECRSGENVYGPFSKALVEHCRTRGGGTACESMRLHKSYAESFRPTGRNPLSVPYFYQYANANEPGRTCNLTSVAMVARFYGINVTPDQIYNRVGGPVFTGNDMIWVAKQYGLKGTYSQTASVATIKSHVDAGRPVILQGWFTSAGHIMVITGYNSTGWIMNDPAGRWDGCFKCGYGGRTSTNGRGVVYSYASVANAATDPGNPNSYWITVLTK